MSRLTTALADRYRIERELGAGGMATVYLAHDVKHERKVALKVLRPELAAVIGAERFLAEIKTTANLQHPHILPLHDSGEVNGTVFYVMPYVEGESLRDRLARETQLPVADAVRIATEVAGALDYAHRHGVIHRDIKPENILLHDGQALVADFGIALAASSAGGTRMTETGMSLGTPHYMSPEQAMGERMLDARTDVYALGCVLYEMLAGEPPFTGPTAQAIVARVMTAEPTPVTEIRKTVPDNVEAAVQTALQKIPADRFPSAAAFADALAGTTAIAPLARGGRPRPVGAARRPPAVMPWLGWTVAAIGIAIGLWGWLRPSPHPVTRFVIGFPPGQALDVSTQGTHLAVSRDGTKLVYAGGDSSGSRLWIKTREALAATPIPGTEGAYDPFFSPDGRQVGFFTDRDGRTMKVTALAGGPPRTLAGAPLGLSGATWATDGYIYFDGDVAGLQRIKPDGGTRQTVVPLDTAQHEVGIAWPQVLPDNRVVLVRLRHGDDTPSEYSILAVRIGASERRVVARAVTARYAAGRLLFVTADGALQTAGFDEGRLTLTEAPIALAEGVRIAGTYAGVDMVVSAAGTLYYVAGPSGVASELEWVERSGATRPVDTTWRESGEVRGFALSPEGDRVALELSRGGAGGTDIWIKRLPSGPLTRLTLNPAADVRPSWSADGRAVLFLSERVSPEAVFLRRADGTGIDSLLARSDRDLTEAYESHDGRWLIARTSNAQAGAGDILAMQIGRDTALRPIVATPAAESNPALSPDGRWLAYVSTASGRREVYVRPFPDADRGVWQVSTDGGVEPKWSHSGTELFFRAISTLDMMAVDVHTSPVFRAGTPRALFHTEAASGFDYPRYDVSPNDRRFLVVGRSDARAQPQLVRVENILQDLKRQESTP
ncbi:MAG: protein kinase domain-containing protein [Gemmatimonadota bacterium]